jgi:hypothetical protein
VNIISFIRTLQIVASLPEKDSEIIFQYTSNNYNYSTWILCCLGCVCACVCLWVLLKETSFLAYLVYSKLCTEHRLEILFLGIIWEL